MNSSVWRRRWRWMLAIPTVLAALSVPADAHGREWFSLGRSGYSSTYNTRAWYDTVRVSYDGLLGNNWQLGHRLDLLRKGLSTGRDLRQRSHRFNLTADPGDRSLGWTLDVEGDESAIRETVDRRTLWTRALVGAAWRKPRTAQVAVEVGAVASEHQASGNERADQGFTRKLTAVYDLKPILTPRSGRLNAQAKFSHQADRNIELASDRTTWSWEMTWDHPGDSIFVHWDERWRDIKFYPAPDDFDRIGRQDHRYRLARVEWSHPQEPHDGAVGMNLLRSVGLSAEVDAGLDRNSYSLVQGEPDGLLPGDVRTTHRSYRLSASRRLRSFHVGFDYTYRWVQERYSESRRNQTAETGSLDARLGWRLRRTDSLGVHAVFRVTSYTVPGGEATFFDDRDQAERVVDVYWWHHFSDLFSVRPLFSYRGFRQVFISEKNSANNNTDNIYLLAPVLRWRPWSSLALTQQFAIRAHYRYNDFSRDDPDGGGTLYRRAESATGVRITRTKRVAWDIRYTYRYEDFGGLYDRDGWVQSVDWDRRSHLIDGRLSWSPVRSLTVRPGLGLEYKQSFQHRREGDDIRRIKDDSFNRRNVSLAAEWNSDTGYMVRLLIARRVQEFGTGPRDRDDRWEFSVEKEFF